MTVLLEARGVTKRFGGLAAVSGVSFVVEEGAITAVIGPNGAGKTTFFNCITGVAPPTSGEVVFRGRRLVDGAPELPPEASAMELLWYVLSLSMGTLIVRISAGKRPLPAHEITRLGMARTFQNIRLFRQMTALENVVTARHCRTRSGVIESLLRLPSMRAEERRSREIAEELLEFVGLTKWRDTNASSLPYGDQRRLEIARALATEPKLLLLDEPAAGMNPRESQDLVELIRRINARGVTILLIEHHMRVVMGVSTHVVVLDHGEKIADGTPEAVRNDPAVIEAYLGKEDVE